MYIGETGRRVADRFANTFVQWRVAIRTYKSDGLPVAEHFNLPDRIEPQQHPRYVSVCGKASEW